MANDKLVERLSPILATLIRLAYQHCYCSYEGQCTYCAQSEELKEIIKELEGGTSQ